MIVSRQGDQLLVTTQPDHAFFSGELLALWREDGFPHHPRRGELLFAAREHDNGWRGADAAPRLDPATERPHTFLTIPRATRFEIWRDGVDRFRAEQPYASLLIAHHALELHGEHREDPEWEPLFSFLNEAHAELLDASESTAEELCRDYRFLELTDLVSLAVCSGWPGPFERGGYDFRIEGDTVFLEPFPLAGATSFEIPCRWIEDRPYDDAIDLTVALASAPWQRRRVRVDAAP